MFNSNIANLSHIFSNKAFKELKFSTKIYSWLGYVRWLACMVLPLAFFFTNRLIFLGIHTGMSLAVLLLSVLSAKDRSGF